MKPRAHLLLPPQPLASCIAAAVVRDTRGAALSDGDRFNCFPATPLVTATYTVEGALRLVQAIDDPKAARRAPVLPGWHVMAPQDAPTLSWSAGEVLALSIAFYPEAWVKLGGTADDPVWPEALQGIVARFDGSTAPDEAWQGLCAELVPLWEARRHAGGLPDWPGSDRLADWSRHLLGRVASAAPGQNVRTLERRLRRWTGRTMQHLTHATTMENLHQRRVKDPAASLAELANDLGFSDQSHMGRAVRRTTGFSPARLNHLIETEEAFWCYRLLGERF